MPGVEAAGNVHIRSTATNAASGLQYEQLIMIAFKEKGLAVKENRRSLLLESICAQSQGSVIEELNANQWIKFAKSLSGCFEALGPAVAPITLLLTILEVSEQVKAKYEAGNISALYLSAITTAKELAPESVKILSAVKEVMERTISDHEITNLEADSRAIEEYLLQDIHPFMKELAIRDTSQIPIDLLRKRRNDVKAKREMLRHNVQVYLRRVEGGLSNMEKQTYTMHTNSLPRYAATCALEVLLMGYYCMLGKLDTEDFMLGKDQEILKQMVEEKSLRLASLCDKYGKNRGELVTKTDESKWLSKSDSKWHVSDAGASDDVLIPKFDLGQYVKKVPTAWSCFSFMQEDGSVKYRTVINILTDYAEQASDNLIETVRTDIRRHMEPAGSVWENQFAEHLNNMRLVLDVLQRHETKISTTIKEAKTSLMASVSQCRE